MKTCYQNFQRYYIIQVHFLKKEEPLKQGNINGRYY